MIKSFKIVFGSTLGFLTAILTVGVAVEGYNKKKAKFEKLKKVMKNESN